jgi:hypothetical protein
MAQNSLHMPVLARSAFYDKVRSLRFQLRFRSRKRAPELVDRDQNSQPEMIHTVDQPLIGFLERESASAPEEYSSG